MNCLTLCPSCKHAISFGYGGYVCGYAKECHYEANVSITSNRTLTEKEIKELYHERSESDG
jgi:hypothetical protein